MSATNVRRTERIGASNRVWFMTADGDPTTGDGLASDEGSWLMTAGDLWQKTGPGVTDWAPFAVAGGVLSPTSGGTGVANDATNTITFVGHYGVTITLTNTTSVTLPTSGTLVNTAVTTLSSLVTVGVLASPHMTSPVVNSGGLTVTAGGETITAGTLAGQAATFTTVTASGLMTASAGLTVGSGQTLTLTGATAAGAPTWSSTQTLNTSGWAATLQTGRTIAITGDLSWTSPAFDGSGNVTAAGTLATVATAGTTGSSTAIPVITINAKGLTTSITTAAVIAPAGTLTGATLASNVLASSLTSVGVLASPHVTTLTVDSGGETITAGTLAAQAITGTTYVGSSSASATQFTATGGASAVATMFKSAGDGLVLRGTTGSVNDFAVYTQANGFLIQNATGTANLAFSGSIAGISTWLITQAGAGSGFTSLSATTLTGTLSTAAQPNVTSLGTLTGLAVTFASTTPVIANSGNNAAQMLFKGYAGIAGHTESSNNGSIIIGSPTTNKQLVIRSDYESAPTLDSYFDNSTTVAGGRFLFRHHTDGTALNTLILSDTAATFGGIPVSGITTLAITGDFGTTGARITKGWFTDLTVTNTITGSVSGSSGSTTGSAATLSPGRNINGVLFDGSAAITVTAAAGTLTGATLNATVTASSLTSTGVLASPHFTSPVIDSGGLTITSGTLAGQAATFTTVTTSGLISGETGNGTRAFRTYDGAIFALYDHVGPTEVVRLQAASGQFNVTLQQTAGVVEFISSTSASMLKMTGSTLATVFGGTTEVKSNLGTTPTDSKTNFTARLTNITTGSGIIRLLFYDAQVDDRVAAISGVRTGPDAGTLTLATYNGSALTAALTITSAQVATFANTVNATTFVGAFTGALTGNADTATTLATARTIGGVSFNGSANITVATATGGFTVSGGNVVFDGQQLRSSTSNNGTALSATGWQGFANTTYGAAILGYGTTSDVTLINRAGTSVLEVTSNTTNLIARGELSVASHLTVASGKKVYIDGGGNTYAIESSADVWSFYAGGTETARITNGSLVVVSGSVITLTMGTTASAANVRFTGAGGSPANSFLEVTSSLRYKKDVVDLDHDQAEFLIMGARPVLYHSRSEHDDPTIAFPGLIAEELELLDARFVDHDEKGRPQSVMYERMVTPLIAVAQRHDQRLAIVETGITDLTDRIRMAEQRLDKLAA